MNTNTKSLLLRCVLFAYFIGYFTWITYADHSSAITNSTANKRTGEQSFDQIKNLAETGDVNAQYRLGLSYQTGLSIGKNENEAVKWYRKAAEAGHAQAQNELGVAYQTGQGVKTNYIEAIRWYRKSADHGDFLAQFNIARMYADGMGVKKDYGEAVRQFRKAAEQGHPVAQFKLGLAYESGVGILQNYSEAARWYRKAADQGLFAAQFYLGWLYWRGKGVQKDFSQAYFWLSLATKADKFLALEVGSPNSDLAPYMIKKSAKKLSPEQLAFAQEQVSHWAPSNGPIDISNLEQQLFYFSKGNSYAIYLTINELNKGKQY